MTPDFGQPINLGPNLAILANFLGLRIRFEHFKSRLETNHHLRATLTFKLTFCWEPNRVSQKLSYEQRLADELNL